MIYPAGLKIDKKGGRTIVNTVQAITNGEVNAVAPPTVRTGGGKYQAIQDAVMRQTLKTDDTEKKKTGLESGIFGLVVSMIHRQDGANGALEQKVSMCRDSGLSEVVNGIAGILEGFGLLNFKTGEETLPEGLGKILEDAFAKAELLLDGALPQQAEGAAGDMQAEINVLPQQANLPQQAKANTIPQQVEINALPQQAKANTIPQQAKASTIPQQAEANTIPQQVIAKDMVSPEEIAGMLKSNREEITDLVARYLCSFANTNKKGADEKAAGTAGGQDVQAQDALPVQAEPEAQAPGKAADRLLLLLQQAAAVKAAPKTAKPDVGETAQAKAAAKEPEQLGLPAPGAPDVQKPQAGAETARQDAVNAMQPEKADIADNLADIVEKISSQIVQDEREFDVKLKPEFLGRLTIKLTMGSDGLKAQLKAADASVKNIILNELPALEAMLKEKGVNVANIDVTYESPAFNASGQPHRENREQSGSQGRRYIPAGELPIADMTFEYLAEPYMALRNSSIEFTA